MNNQLFLPVFCTFPDWRKNTFFQKYSLTLFTRASALLLSVERVIGSYNWLLSLLFWNNWENVTFEWNRSWRWLRRGSTDVKITQLCNHLLQRSVIIIKVKIVKIYLDGHNQPHWWYKSRKKEKVTQDTVSDHPEVPECWLGDCLGIRVS